MAIRTLTGNAPTVAQVVTITPSAPAVGETFIYTISNKVLTYTAPATPTPTVATVCAGIKAMLSASTSPAEFADVTWADNTTTVTGTAKVAGKPFTVSKSGTGTHTLTTTTTSSGPNDASLGTNWGGTAPTAGDDVVLDGLVSNANLLYNLDQSAVGNLASFKTRNKYSGRVGLNEVNTAGYAEYRAKYLKYAFASGSEIDIDCDSQQFKLDFSASVVNIHVANTGTSGSETGFPALALTGAVSGSTLEANKGNIGTTVTTGLSMALNTVTIGYVTSPQSDVNIVFGDGTGLATINAKGGTFSIPSAPTALNTVSIVGPVTAYIASNSITTSLTNYGGTVYWMGTGTLAAYTGGFGSVLDTSHDTSARTITTAALYRGARINDPFKTISWTNSITTIDLRMSDLASSDFGKNFNFKVT